MRDSRQFDINVGDIALAVVEWSGDGDPVLLLHATGFHSRCWNEVVRLLPDRHIYAVDLRFHGESGAAGDIEWNVMVDDIVSLMEQLTLTNVIGVGHSLGGYIMARACARTPERFNHLILIDPVIMAPQRYADMREQLAGVKPADHPVSRRKNRWRDAQEIYKRFKDRSPFDTWQDQVLRDYCDYALAPHNDNEWRELACDPINEASLYLQQDGNDVIHKELPLIDTPVTLLRAPRSEDPTPDFNSSPTWTELASALPNCKELYLADHNHFIPMQDPQLVAQQIAQID